MQNAVTIQDVRALVERLDSARSQEFELAREVNIWEREVKEIKALAVQAAYDNKEINTKNNDTRSAGEKAAVAAHSGVAATTEELDMARLRLDNAKAVRMSLEDEASLTRAWLYSQAGMPLG